MNPITSSARNQSLMAASAWPERRLKWRTQRCCGHRGLHRNRLGNQDRWMFTRNRVWIERRDGTVVEERSDPRAAFAGHVRETPWDRLHLTYFLGYAVW